jgi:hypothetical protein
MLPSTVHRVPRHTPNAVNEQIQQQTEQNIRRWATASPHELDRRLAELDREWDIERALEANAATVSLVGLALGATVDRRLFALPAIVGGFLLQHALQGWCPPVPLLRRWGFRTSREIEEERFALKAVRGDFRDLPAGPRPDRWGVDQVLAAVRR